MERPHYRRVSGGAAPKGVKHGNPGGHSTFSERLVTQFIICGVIMAVILILNLINASLTNTVKSVIQDQPTVADVKQVITDASDSVKTIFGNTKDNKATDGSDPASGADAKNLDSPVPAVQQQDDQKAAGGTQPASSQTPAGFRIDEDILTQIQADSGGQ